MKYLVTGAAGFIGAYLVKSLTSENHEVLGIDNYSEYYSASLKISRVHELIPNPKKIILQHDLSDETETDKLIQKFSPDVVFHLAAQPGVRIPLENYKFYTRDNLVSFTSVLTSCIRNEVPQLVYASSSSVYGNSSLKILSEDQTNLKPVSFYGVTKLTNEMMVQSVIPNSKTRARGLRFFTVYGPWGRPDMAYFRLIANGITGFPFTLFGDGSVQRDFTYIDDVINCTIMLSKELEKREPGFVDVVNIGGGRPESMNSLIREISTHFGISNQFPHSAHVSQDVKFTKADTKYLQQLIGTTPCVTLESGIKNVVSWTQNDLVISKLKNWISSVN